MSYYDPFGRRSRAGGRSSSGSGRSQRGRSSGSNAPTVEDYYQIAEMLRHLQEEHETQGAKLRNTEQALEEQTRRAIELHEELMRTRAALEEVEKNQKEEKPNQADSDWHERYIRLQAETENYRRRLEIRTAQESAEQRNQILRDMLSLADHLEMALEHIDRSAGAPAGDEASSYESFRSNLEATRAAFLETLRRYGVTPLSPLGEPFDPERHEAVGQIPSDEIPEDHVAAVVQTGYVADDRLLRPARVMVSGG